MSEKLVAEDVKINSLLEKLIELSVQSGTLCAVGCMKQKVQVIAAPMDLTWPSISEQATAGGASVADHDDEELQLGVDEHVLG